MPGPSVNKQVASERVRQYYRRGPDHRQGRSVTFLDVKKAFDLYQISVGRWVTQQEQAAAANHFYDALADLMAILGGTPELISMRGTLSLKYGTGGQRGVAAHYEPQFRTLALAKNAGPGSLAHEWFHALDHYLGKHTFPGTDETCFASIAWLADEKLVDHPIAQALCDCFRTIMLSDDGSDTSPLFKASAAVDRATGQLYYSRPEEMAARAFEAYVQDSALINHYLVKGTKASPEAEDGLYPSGAHRTAINAAFERYFKRLGRALAAQQQSSATKQL